MSYKCYLNVKEYDNLGLLPDWQEGLRNKAEKVAAYIH